MSNTIILADADGSWENLQSDWKNQCDQFDEEFDSYAEGTFSIITPLIKNPNRQASVIGFLKDNKFEAICQINTSLIKGYSEPVLRVRHITIAPEVDFGGASIGEYARILVNIFFGILEISNQSDYLQAKHLKFHLRSLADQQFFAALGEGLNKSEQFASVHTKGAWLYVTKA